MWSGGRTRSLGGRGAERAVSAGKEQEAALGTGARKSPGLWHEDHLKRLCWFPQAAVAKSHPLS